MTARNPIKIVSKEPKTNALTAAEWAAIAREKGLSDHAKAWDAKALELGEERIPNGMTIRYQADGTKRRFWIKP